MKRFLGILFALVLVFSLAAIGLASPVLAQPSDVWVDDDFTPATPGWGSTHFDKIQDGIDALAGSVVHVAAGTYYENITLVDGVQLLGVGADVTIIDGGGTGSVVTASGIDGEAVLDGFTITHGSSHQGGGIDARNASLVISNNIIRNNSADDCGGGILTHVLLGTISNNVIRDNTSQHFGGGICNLSSSPTVINCNFSSNSANDDGGGMYNDNYSSPNITDCTFFNNSAGWGGGMYNYWYSSPIITNCYFDDNSAINGGGGMHSHADSSPTVTNCLFVNNSSNMGWGGGIQQFGVSWLTLTNCTIFGNSGGGMFIAECSPIVTNSIFWNNGYEIVIDGGGTLTTVSYSDIQGGYSGIANINADPMIVDPLGGDYHLKPGSPCIDKGTNVGALTEDIEGNPRPIDGDIDGTATIDMGAYEYVPTQPQPPPQVPGVTFWGGIAMASILGLLMVYMVRRRQAASWTESDDTRILGSKGRQK